MSRHCTLTETDATHRQRHRDTYTCKDARSSKRDRRDTQIDLELVKTRFAETDGTVANDHWAHSSYLCVAVCCSVLQCVANEHWTHSSYLYVAVCRGVLRCVAVFCKWALSTLLLPVCYFVLQCVALFCEWALSTLLLSVCYSVLQFVAENHRILLLPVCCSVLLCVAVCCGKSGSSLPTCLHVRTHVCTRAEKYTNMPKTIHIHMYMDVRANHHWAHSFYLYVYICTHLYIYENKSLNMKKYLHSHILIYMRITTKLSILLLPVCCSALQCVACGAERH